MRLSLVIQSLNCGGAERVMSIMANYWAEKAWEITLITLDDGSTQPFFEIDCRVRIIPLALAGSSRTALDGLWKNLMRVFKLRRAILKTNPDAVISFMGRTNVITLLATRGTKVPVLVSDRSDPALSSPGRFWKGLSRCTYPRAEIVVVQTQVALGHFSRGVRSHALIIPNPVLPPSQPQKELGFVLTKPLAASMGRLIHAKGFDLVLRAFARISCRHPQWTLAIVGEGPLRTTLEDLCDELRIRDRVLFTGLVKDPAEILSRADLFVMSSRFEGFPNALCEAMGHGVAVISTDCPSGPRAIIRNNIDGILIPNGDVGALAAAMDRLMGDEGERKRLGLIATCVTERFRLDKVMAMWEAALSRALHQQPSALRHTDARIARAR